jgi:hypothetical protein
MLKRKQQQYLKETMENNMPNVNITKPIRKDAKDYSQVDAKHKPGSKGGPADAYVKPTAYPTTK